MPCVSIDHVKEIIVDWIFFDKQFVFLPLWNNCNDQPQTWLYVLKNEMQTSQRETELCDANGINISIN